MSSNYLDVIRSVHISLIRSCRTPSNRINRELQGGEDPLDPLSSRSFSTKKPLIIGLFCGFFSWILHPMTLRHSASAEYSAVVRCAQIIWCHQIIRMSWDYSISVTRFCCITATEKPLIIGLFCGYWAIWWQTQLLGFVASLQLTQESGLWKRKSLQSWFLWILQLSKLLQIWFLWILRSSTWQQSWFLWILPDALKRLDWVHWWRFSKVSLS